MTAAAPIASITKTSSYERRVAISLEGDRRQESVIDAVQRMGFEFDWNAILSDIEGASESVDAIESAIAKELRGSGFRDTADALAVSGRLIATFIQQRHEEEIGLRAPPLLTFAEPTLWTPEGTVTYWQKILGLTDQQAAQILASLKALDAQRAAMAARVREAVRDRVQSIFAKANLTGANIGEGDTLRTFIANAREIMPDASRAILETEYRTRLTTEYEGRKQELVVSRANVFPFTQFFALLDGRETWYCCGPMGRAVNGRGYIAATEDRIWLKFRPPCHFRCRSTLSPISYREAQRMCILAKDGRTKIALVGSNPNRPYGDPPAFATDPDTGKVRAVQPQEGFGS